MPEPDARRPAASASSGPGGAGPTEAEVSAALQRVVAALVVLESLLLMAGVVVLAIDSGSAEAAVMIVVGLAFAVGLLAAAAGALQGRRWSRGPILTWQLVQGGIALSMLFSPSWWIGVPLLGIAVVTGVLVAGGRVIAREQGF